MVFLFQDQNQGIRNDVELRENARPAANRSLPSGLYRRLRIHTESADPSALTKRESHERKALAGSGDGTLTAGGDLHPALRTSVARDGRPPARYDQARAGSKRLSAWSHAKRRHLPLSLFP